MCEQEFKIEMNLYFCKTKFILKLETYESFNFHVSKTLQMLFKCFCWKK
jgi:hypothetical protein